jgi:heme oxygenase (biliverdin-IX-beta and delta-forming)
VGGVHESLRRETRRHHLDVERQVGFTADGLPLGAYVRLLRALHGFHAPLEARLLEAATGVAAPPFALRRRTALLARDLAALGVGRDELARTPRCEDLPPLGDPAQIAGCLYVVEGAALGGQQIARVMARRLGLDPVVGLAFFVGDGAGTGDRWREVLAWLDSVGSADGRRRRMVDSACATFDALARWLRACGGDR